MSAVAFALALVVAAPEQEPAWLAFKKKTDESAEPSERAQKIAAFWDRVFAAPAAHDWDLELSVGWQFWQRAHGVRADNWLFRATARRQLHELPGGGFLGATAFFDATWLNAGTNQLDYDQTQFTAGVGAGFLRWHGPFRFDATLEGGALLRSTTIADGLSPDRHASVVEPAVGITGGAAVAFYGQVVFGLRGGVRYHPGRLDVLWMVDLGWLVD